MVASLLPDAAALFAAGGVRDWQLLQDQAPAHKARSTQQFLRRKGVRLLEKYPPSAADLNPIEHLWAWMKKRVYRRAPTTQAQLEAVVRGVWEEVPNELCAKLAASMESRWARVVQLDGAYIE